ncbi:hypothetical protein Nepgr_004133 [Nepenthes gracilis]|uniref:Uncharacterized protein n=1 Tax=Nepenthes gracilis TaxID=150966 RepID=A0AAD3XEN7_NEPGR|nr:hypothetical protein Nepgr_004133 [Nepenthes gracilis]
MASENKGACEQNTSLWSKVLESHHQSGVRSLKRKQRISMRKRTLVYGSKRKRFNGIDRQIKTLQKLVRNSKTQGLEGLLCDAAEYIMSLQIRVRIMQAMVNALSGP